MHFGYILLNCDIGAEEYVAEEIRKIPQISNIHLTFGAYDIVAEMHAEDQKEFDRTVTENIRSLSRVISTMTLNVTDGVNAI